MMVSLHQRLKTYVDHVRSDIETSSQNLFLTQDGKAFKEGTIGRRITEFWAKTGVSPDINMTSTTVRQMGCGTTVKNTDQDKRILHRHMTHCEPVADRFYFKLDTKTIAGKGHKILKKNIGYEDEDEDEDERRPLSPDDKEALEMEFEDEINSTAPLTVELLEQRIGNSVALLHLLASTTTIKQALNHMRYKQRLSTKTNLAIQTVDQTKKTEQWLKENMEIKSLGGRSRTKWEEEDTETLKEFYANFHVCPDKSQIQTHLESDRLKHILDKEGWKRCYQKVKNLFK